jgi:hypothetical protein
MASSGVGSTSVSLIANRGIKRTTRSNGELSTHKKARTQQQSDEAASRSADDDADSKCVGADISRESPVNGGALLGKTLPKGAVHVDDENDVFFEMVSAPPAEADGNDAADEEKKQTAKSAAEELLKSDKSAQFQARPLPFSNKKTTGHEWCTKELAWIFSAHEAYRKIYTDVPENSGELLRWLCETLKEKFPQSFSELPSTGQVRSALNRYKEHWLAEPPPSAQTSAAEVMDRSPVRPKRACDEENKNLRVQRAELQKQLDKMELDKMDRDRQFNRLQDENKRLAQQLQDTMRQKEIAERGALAACIRSEEREYDALRWRTQHGEVVKQLSSAPETFKAIARAVFWEEFNAMVPKSGVLPSATRHAAPATHIQTAQLQSASPSTASNSDMTASREWQYPRPRSRDSRTAQTAAPTVAATTANR